MKLLSIVAACVLALTVGQASADTFQDFKITGTYDGIILHPFTGSVTIDVTTLEFTAVSVSVEGGFVMLGGPRSDSGFQLTSTVKDFGCTPNTYTDCFDSLSLNIASPAYLLAFQSGTVSGSYNCQLCGYGGYIHGIIAPVPLPTALPLFATGLGVLVLIARRRKRI